MRPIKMSNKQIKDILNDIRAQLIKEKFSKESMSVLVKLPTVVNKEKAIVVFTQQALFKMRGLIKGCTMEIGWHGTVTRQDNIFTIEDIFTFPQTVTASTVTPDATEYSNWLMSQPDDIFNKLRFHGHSHVNMAVSPSGVDTGFQEDMLKNLNDFYIFGIFNKKDENYLIIYDVANNIVYEDKDIMYTSEEDDAIKWADEQIEKYVKRPGLAAGSMASTAGFRAAVIPGHKPDSKTPGEKSLTERVARTGYSAVDDYYSGYYGDRYGGNY